MPWPVQSLDVFDLFRRSVRVPLESIAGFGTDIATLQAQVAALTTAVADAMTKFMYQAVDEKPTGTNGGNSAAGVNIRTLNTERIANIAGASLAANQVTLPAGTYRLWASGPCYKGNAHKVYIYNVTDASVAVPGSSENASATDISSTISYALGRITIAAPKVFEVRHQINAASAGIGLGIAAGGGVVETYAMLTAWQE